jgi:hypothetical protein
MLGPRRATRLGRLLFLVLLTGWAAAAQERALAPLVRGVFVLYTGSDANGSFSLEVERNTHQCSFSSKTYFERDHRRTSVSRIAQGQLLEVLSERTVEPPRCRALIVRVITEERLEQRQRLRAASPTEYFAPRGNLILTGVIVRMDHQSLLLRTRSGDRHAIQLRRDTKYLAGGLPADLASVPLNAPVQIRAGRTYDQHVEAFSLVWGDILRPPPR